MKNKILSLLAALFFMGGPSAFALDNGDSLWTPYGADQYSLNTGNVGIGTQGPSPAKLYVVGNIAATGTITGSGTVSIGTTVVNNALWLGSEYQAGTIGVGTTNINANNGNMQNVGISTNGTNSYLTFTPPTTGVGTLSLRIKQDSSGNRALPSGAWPGTFLWSGGTAPTLTTTANKSDWIVCKWNGTNWYCVPTLNF